MKARNRFHQLTGIAATVAMVLVASFGAGQMAVAAETSTKCTVGSSTIQQCFPDSAFASAIAKAAGTSKGSVFSSSVQKKVTKLDAKVTGIQSIKGISNLTNLTSVDLSNNSIKDVSEVASLKNLQIAKFYGNNITDVKPFASLTRLTELGLGDNSISDISSLSALHSLTFVNVSHNSITSISALTGNKSMKYVFAAGNKITDGSPVNQFPNLVGADLSENQIMDVSKITADPVSFLLFQNEAVTKNPSISQGGSVTIQMPKLPNGKWAVPIEYSDGGKYDAAHGTVTWSNLSWSTPKPLKATFMTQIKAPSRSNDLAYSGSISADFNFGPAQLTSSNWRQYLQNNNSNKGDGAVERYNGETNSTVLNDYSVSEQKAQTAVLGAAAASSTNISSPVQASASHSCVSKTFQSCFADSKLAAAVASSLGKKVGDSISSKDVAKLTSVTASGLGITSLSGIESFPNVTKLVADNNKISDLSPLASLSSLVYLSLYENKVTDVMPLANLKKLDGVALGGNQISSINALKNLGALQWIDLYGNKVSDPSALANLTNLVNIWLEGNGLSKFPDFSKLVRLQKLQLEWNNIADVSLASRMNLSQYATVAEQHINSSSTVKEGSNVSLTTPIGQFGQHIRPSVIIPSDGVYNSKTGVVTWSKVSKSGDYSVQFQSSYDHFKYAGLITLALTVQHTDTVAPYFVGGYPTKVTAGADFDPFDSVHAYDAVDGDVTNSIALFNWQKFSTAKAGTSFKLNYLVTDKSGNTAYLGRQVEVTNAKIQDRPENETLQISTEAGVAPKLPSAVYMPWSDGSKTQEYVNWNSIDPKLYAKANEFDVYGTAHGAKVKAHIKVHQASNDTTVYYKNTDGWSPTRLEYRYYKTGDSFTKPTGAKGKVSMSSYCDGWSVATIKNTGDVQLQFGFGDAHHWDDAGGWYNAKNASAYVYSQAKKNSYKIYAGAPTCPASAAVPVSSVSVSPSSAALTVGGTKQLSVSVSPSNATNKSVTWKSSDSSIASVSNTGLVTAKKAGKATITVSSSNGKAAHATITVKQTTAPVQATQSMYRLYNPYSGEHFYTAVVAERNHLKSVGWRYEGIGWVAPVKSGKPVYRLYNPYAGDHHYTTNAAERDMLTKVGWKYEGIGWYSAENTGRAPLYREYNPNAVSGAHNYTLNKAEHNNLVRLGWRDEGLAWYAVHA